ncbi:Uncharacterised protein [Legionella donaldsonii]|uniref:Uncharacterized protein n=1 Tax=Legionella donaldsonii TaxID=45060 RepID=A0A378KK21_9GAMM|nr:hypothetical protein [Legionella donaldsonii]STX84889.1 Uncharacterised protein [Legionella donaldsonii]
MLKKLKGNVERGLVTPLMAQVLCLHGVFAGLGLMMLVAIH